MYVPFGEWRPDVSDLRGQASVVLSNVLPRGDGYGPISDLSALSAALPAACRGAFFGRKSDGSILIFAATANQIYTLNNSTYTWTPVSKVAAVTSITNASPGVVNYTSHGFSANDPVVFSTSGALPTGLTAGTVYYVKTVVNADSFTVSATAGGTAINTSSAGSGTHSVTARYSSLASTDLWQFAQYGNYVFAVQANVAPQVFDLSSSTAFADLGGSPPQAKFISIVSRFVVLSGLTSNPYRIQWSGLDATTTWTSGTNSSDYQDFADGGPVLGVAGGETGVVFQGGCIRRMTYAPGSPIIFQIDRVTRDLGLYAPYSLITSNDKIYFYATQGFHEMSPVSYPVPIGKEKFDRTFAAEYSATNPQLMIGVSDPKAGRVFWSYKTNTGASGLFDKVLVYDTVLGRGASISLTGEFLCSISQPGITLESLDTVSSSIDALTQSLDSYESASTPELAAVNSSHVVCTFRGSNLEATLETPQYGNAGEGRFYLRGLRPISDATTIYASILKRETQQASFDTTAESTVNSIGFCPMRVSTRYARAKIRIPAASTWTFASGIEADAIPDGER